MSKQNRILLSITTALLVAFLGMSFATCGGTLSEQAAPSKIRTTEQVVRPAPVPQPAPEPTPEPEPETAKVSQPDEARLPGAGGASRKQSTKVPCDCPPGDPLCSCGGFEPPQPKLSPLPSEPEPEEETAFEPPEPNIPEPEPTVSTSLVDRVLSKLALGNLVFNPPKEMKIKERKTIELLLSPKETIAALTAKLPKKDQATAETAKDIKVSNRMEATLTGTGFTIKALTPDTQAVSSKTTRWAWETVPTETGTQTLHLSLSAHIKVDGTDTPLVVKTFDRTVEVKISPIQAVTGFLKKYWQWILGTLLVPLFGWWLKRRFGGGDD